jgi:hypothetical protein
MTVFDEKYIEQGLLQEFGEKSARGDALGWESEIFEG